MGHTSLVLELQERLPLWQCKINLGIICRTDSVFMWLVRILIFILIMESLHNQLILSVYILSRDQDFVSCLSHVSAAASKCCSSRPPIPLTPSVSFPTAPGGSVGRCCSWREAWPAADKNISHGRCSRAVTPEKRRPSGESGYLPFSPQG